MVKLWRKTASFNLLRASNFFSSVNDILWFLMKSPEEGDELIAKSLSNKKWISSFPSLFSDLEGIAQIKIRRTLVRSYYFVEKKNLKMVF